MRAASLVYDGADLRNHTYARYGHEVLKQPQQFADRFSMARSCTCSVDEYRMREVTRARADPLEDLAPRLEGVDGQRLLETVRAFNNSDASTCRSILTSWRGAAPWASRRRIPNWANPLDTSPFEAYQVTCGITFTFGGLGIDENARVLDTELQPIPGGLMLRASWSAICCISTIRAAPG